MLAHQLRMLEAQKEGEVRCVWPHSCAPVLAYCPRSVGRPTTHTYNDVFQVNDQRDSLHTCLGMGFFQQQQYLLANADEATYVRK